MFNLSPIDRGVTAGPVAMWETACRSDTLYVNALPWCVSGADWAVISLLFD